MKFCSYCWSLGSTSFRVKELNYKNEQLLMLLDEFWKENFDWNTETQVYFYELMKDRGLLTGDARRKDKDARQKTSGLHELGLVYHNRRITPVGYAILNKAKQDEFSNGNIFGLESDSYLYLLQLLKLRPSVDVEFYDYYHKDYTIEHVETDEFYRPFVRLLHLLCHFDYITKDEFTYLLPLLAYSFSDTCLIQDINDIRNGKYNIDNILLKQIMRMPNYRKAFKFFRENNTNYKDIFSAMNMSRKGSSYDENLFIIYNSLKEILLLNKTLLDTTAISLWEKLDKEWRGYIFKPDCTRGIIKSKSIRDCLNTIVLNINIEDSLKDFFFKTNHLIRWKKNLKDYADLNKRYFKLCDIIYFEGETIKLDTFSKAFFSLVFDYRKGKNGEIKEQFFIKESISTKDKLGLYDLISLDDLLLYVPDTRLILKELKEKYGIQLQTKQEINIHIRNEKINKLEKLIDDKFNNEKIIELLDYFEQRGEADKKIKDEITDNATIPTLFEYVLAIAWHKINKRKGNLLEAMNLSLDIDMLPKSHATGGQADIIFKYEANDIIPQHQLLLEATLSDSTTQRRMELEPVSRHLWHVMKESNNQNDYAILVSTNIHPSVISDFRGRKSMEMTFDDNYFVDGMKMLPISTKMIQFMLANEMTYEQIYQILDNAHNSELSLRENWYGNTILQYFQ